MAQLAPSTTFPASQASPTFLALADARQASDAAEQAHWDAEHNGATRSELAALAAAADAAQDKLHDAAVAHRFACEAWRCEQADAHRAASRHSRTECPTYVAQEAARAAELATFRPLTADHFRVYRTLQAYPASNVNQVNGDLGLGPDRIQVILDDLVQLELVTRDAPFIGLARYTIAS